MKVVSAQEMARIENLAYQAGASEEAFMDKAGDIIAQKVMSYCFDRNFAKNALLLCGKGNNAGDAFVCGKVLLNAGFEVVAYHFSHESQCSKLCQKKGSEFRKNGGKILTLPSAETFQIKSFSIVVDGLFGTGFKGEVVDPYKTIIENVNQSKIPIISIDIPSGINGSTGEIGGIAVQATQTIFLGFPKTGCLLGPAWNYVGQFYVENFGLEQRFIDQARADFILIDDEFAKNHLPIVQKNRHKYQAGYVVGLGGSLGMPGAAMLSSYAALRTGAGIVRLLHPNEMRAEFAFAPYELVRQGYDYQDMQSIVEALNNATAIFIGPGIGKHPAVSDLLKQVLPLIQKKCVIDADALTVMAQLDCVYPKETIITPHHGEMRRLLHIDHEASKIDEINWLAQVKQYSKERQVTVVLKGSPTFIFKSEETPYINLRGTPGMATAGTGDVLTGMITALLAQNVAFVEAAVLGVYLHALAGEYSKAKKTDYSMIATDLIEEIPTVYSHLIDR